VAQIRAIHYLNQFFGGLGGEERADATPVCFEGARGPGLALARLEPRIEIAATVVAGDNYIAEHLDGAVDEVVKLIAEQHAAAPIDLLLAGPAFNAGRYGMACAAICTAVEQQLGIPSLTALYPDNAAVDVYRRQVTIVATAADVMGMQAALAALASTGMKRAAGDPVGPADQVLSRGLRSNYFAGATGAERAIEMLLARLEERPFTTEYPMPRFDRVAPALPIASAADAVVALVTTGGIVPRGNPDRIESASASRFGAYPLAGLDALTSETHRSVHGGYDPTYANENPNRVLPLDEARALERAGRIGRLHETYYATVGNATSVTQARRFGTEIAPLLVNEGVQAVILTST
jgi:glycine reductase